MARMCAESSGNSWLTRALFHSLVSLVRRSETMRSMFCKETGPIGFRPAPGLN